MSLARALRTAALRSRIRFSKASKKRGVESFKKVYQKLTKKFQIKIDREKYMICPIDSTVISLTSKLLHNI